MRIKQIRIVFPFILMVLSLNGCVHNNQKITEGVTEAVVNEQSDTWDIQEQQEEEKEQGKEEAMDMEYSLKEVYKDKFLIGVALNPNTITDTYKNRVISNFNSVTCENEMKPDYVLSKTKCKQGVADDPSYVAVDFSACKSEMEFCEENGIRMRYHTLVWHAQTPKWFFYEDYDIEKNLAAAELMKERMKKFIFAVVQYLDANHPDLIYTIDVVNEAFNGNGDYGIKDEDNLWYDTIGYDYLYYAFLYAREAVASSEHMNEVTLVYNDYGMSSKADKVITGLDAIFIEHDNNVHDYVDSIGFQAHLDTNTPMAAVAEAMKQFWEEGYELQITELDIGIPDVKVGDTPSKEAYINQGKKYKSLMERVVALKEEGCNISSVSVWGISDDQSWRMNNNGYNAYALLFNSDLSLKQAYYGMALDPEIFSYYTIGLNN